MIFILVNIFNQSVKNKRFYVHFRGTFYSLKADAAYNNGYLGIMELFGDNGVNPPQIS